MRMIVRLLWIVFYFSMVQSSHFFGGTVSWKPLNNTDLNSTVSVMFTQSYQWRQLQTHCDQTYITNKSPKIPTNVDQLQCVSSSCGSYTPLSVSGYCTDFSTLLDSSASQISDVESITAASKFCVTYRSAAWPGHQSASCNFSCYVDIAKWSIGCCVDLTPRLDGLINTPPIATVISPIRVPTNTSYTITIPVSDADGDETRCRWAQNTSTFDECGDICGEIPGSILDAENCIFTLNSTGKQAGTFYAVALMVEDFSNESNDTALSSIPVQFLIEIIAKPTCLLKPMITSNATTNTILRVGQSIDFTVTIEPGCLGTSIVDYFRTSPLDMQKSNITFDAVNNIYMLTETWTPTNAQTGSQIYCAMATDSASIQSDLYCLTFSVLTEVKKNNTKEEGSGDTTEFDASQFDSTMSTMPVSTIFITLLPFTTETTTTTTETTTTTTTSTSSTSDTTTTTTTTTETTATTTTSSTSTTTTTETTSTTTTSQTTSTSSTSATTTTTSSTSSSTSTSSSSSSTSTSTSSSTSTTSTSTSTSTTSTTTTTTTTAEESVTVTVLIPVTTKDNSGFIGLGLGLGLPLLAALIGFTFSSCFPEQCTSLSNYFRRHFFKRVQNTDNNQTMSSNERFTDYKDDNQTVQGDDTRDYRQEYIKVEDETNIQSILPDEEHPLPQENSFACASTSDLELNTLNATTTSFFSPSMNSLPNDNVQYIKQTSTKTNFTLPNGSVLVRAYSQQQRNKSDNLQ